MRYRILSLLPLFLLISFTQPLWAQNDQTVVLGYGWGPYSTPADEVRGDRDMIRNQLWLEWYALGSVGFGVRRVAMVELGLGLLAFGGFEVLSFTSTLATVNWVVLGGESYGRLGVLAGAGPAEYKYHGKIFGVERKAKSGGTATMASIYLDWGGESFGARLGADTFATQLDKVEGLQPDASGQGWYLDLRWAW